MVANVLTLAFQGIEAVGVNVQVQVSSGLPMFTIVGLPDKTVGESRERVRACFGALGLDLPLKRIIVNLAPADLQKEGSHYDLPIAVALLIAMGIIAQDQADDFIILGELGLDGSIAKVNGALPAAITANARNLGLVCPGSSGKEAAWAGNPSILAPYHLLELINHWKGTQVLSPPTAAAPLLEKYSVDFSEVKGQVIAKRALAIAAAGYHNVLMIGPPGAGKSMLAARLPSILPELTPAQALEVTMIHSLSGQLPETGLIQHRPFRDPHHSASLPALVGGGMRCKPGEISLAHHGILFLDELPEFSRQSLESLRQPIETGRVTIARANSHVTYPARFQLIAAMNPCRCGYFGDRKRECAKAPKCALDYQAKISGPLMDRFDIVINVPEVPVDSLLTDSPEEKSETLKQRIAVAHQRQQYRADQLGYNHTITASAHISNDLLNRIIQLTDSTQQLLTRITENFKLSGRGYHRLLRVARTIADLEGSEPITPLHLSEAIGYRKVNTFL